MHLQPAHDPLTALSPILRPLNSVCMLQANHDTAPELHIASAVFAVLHLKNPLSLCMGCSSLAAMTRLMPYTAAAMLRVKVWSQHGTPVASDLVRALQAAASDLRGAGRLVALQQLLLQTGVCLARQDLLSWDAIDWTLSSA